MTRPIRIATIALSTALTALSLTAVAHTGHGVGDSHGFVDGLTHPFLGADHLLAMLLVGAWSVLHARRIWLAPLTFVALLTLGALFGQNGFSVPALEPLIAASVLILGLMLTRPRQLGLPSALAVIGGFALFHGMAHGSELSANSQVLGGIVLGSAVLHAIGMRFAQRVLAHRPERAVRLGQALAVVGGGLMLSAVL